MPRPRPPCLPLPRLPPAGALPAPRCRRPRPRRRTAPRRPPRRPGPHPPSTCTRLCGRASSRTTAPPPSWRRPRSARWSCGTRRRWVLAGRGRRGHTGAAQPARGGGGRGKAPPGKRCWRCCPRAHLRPPAPKQKLCAEELKKGIMGVDPALPSTITAFPPGYIDKDKEVGAGCWHVAACGCCRGGMWVLAHATCQPMPASRGCGGLMPATPLMPLISPPHHLPPTPHPHTHAPMLAGHRGPADRRAAEARDQAAGRRGRRQVGAGGCAGAGGGGRDFAGRRRAVPDSPGGGPVPSVPAVHATSPVPPHTLPTLLPRPASAAPQPTATSWTPRWSAPTRRSARRTTRVRQRG